MNTLADGGGIYTGPQCTWGVIRNNLIENIKGVHSNRGIFLDDGAKNLSIYGNHVRGTANCYDIDLRYSTNYAEGIPDHNTNNIMFGNVLTGGYRFEDAGSDSHCIGGQNVLLGIGMFQKTKVDLSRRAFDIQIESCTYKKGELTIPKQYAEVLKSVRVDSFVRRYLTVH